QGGSGGSGPNGSGPSNSSNDSSSSSSTTTSGGPSAGSGGSSSVASSAGSGGSPGGMGDDAALFCSGSHPVDCTCFGCRPTCCDENGAVSDCVCSACKPDPPCSDPANCDNTGLCDPLNEGCSCADCAGHPACQ